VGGLPERACISHSLPIHGYDYNSDWSNPLHVYGTDIEKIHKLDDAGNESLSDQFYLSKNQISWAVREEMAMTVEDVLARRSRALFLNAKATLALAPKVAQIIADEAGHDQDWIDQQIKEFTALTQNYLLS
jgi:glycerol-3-phosphate dehydrogenase